MTTATFTKTITPQFERDGRRNKLVGQLGEIRDESGLLIHSQSYDSTIEAEQALDDLVYELLVDYAERGLVDALPVEVPAPVAEIRYDHVTVNQPRLTERNVHIHTGSTVELVKSDGYDDSYWSLLVDGRYYPLVMVKFIYGRPEIEVSLQNALTQVQQAIAALNAPRCATCGGEGDCPDCEPIAIGMHFEHLGFGTGTVINITDDERLNVQVKFDSPSRFGSKFWFDANEVRPRAVTAQSIAIDAKISTCGYCRGIHHIQQCTELRGHVRASEADWRIAVGRTLCAMRWRAYAAFVALLLSAPTDQLIVYARSYQAFIKDYSPDSNLTVNDILQAWTRDMQRGSDRGPAAPAMRAA